MVRPVPRFDLHLDKETQRTLALIDQFELAKARQKGQAHPQKITQRSIDLVYELAYLNIFKAWEMLLEETFVRFLCGYSNSAGPPVFRPNTQRQRNLKDAAALMLGGSDYRLWH